MYGRGYARTLPLGRWRVYHGVWGSGLFQSIYAPAPYMILSLPLMPEWYLVILGLLGLSVVGIVWKPLLLSLPLVLFAFVAPLVQAITGAMHARNTGNPNGRLREFKMRALTAFLHLIQPLARLIGRLGSGLAPWRRRGISRSGIPTVRKFALWSESWKGMEDRLHKLEDVLRLQGAVVLRGGPYDRWDLQVRDGMFAAARGRMVIEEHGSGRQLMKFETWPILSSPVLGIVLIFVALSLLAVLDHAWLASAILGLGPLLGCGFMVRDSIIAAGAVQQALLDLGYKKV